MNGARSWMLYGAAGHTGALIARHAHQRGHRPLLAGRNAPATAALAGLKQLQAEGADVPLVLATRLRDSWGALVAPFGGTSARCSTVTSTNAPTR